MQGTAHGLAQVVFGACKERSKVGAGLVLSAGDVVLKNSWLTYNVGTWGLLYISGQDSFVHFENMQVTHNRAVGGTIVYCEVCHDTFFLNTTMKANFADTDGGMLMLENFAGDVLIHNSVIQGNSARSEGGVIYAITSTQKQSNLAVHVFNSVIYNNSAANGGFIYASFHAMRLLNLTSSVFQANRVREPCRPLRSPCLDRQRKSCASRAHVLLGQSLQPHRPP
ncbi:hypothetical protein CYMTET_53394 [Cymbomonas tetramitiformis]|uniref:Right handed beta helix domain-containing protein n=1 Tax=Cymbomonas tetramitiformis TaxID=36881 RepID=A0AAE0ERS5_9CHLO|nr:hypothetical protein CYMTET_53394 [Cymbomonas tetramitiformis]